MLEGRTRPFTLTPLYRVGEAPAEAVAFLAYAAEVLGYGAVFARWWCPVCQRVFLWEDMVVGQVQGTENWLVLCPTADCGGIDWINLRDYHVERQRHPSWPATPASGQHLVA